LASGLDEMRRIIREKEPLKPSAQLSRGRSCVKSPSRSWKSEIDSDLDWIVMQCLEKDRNRRYQTANGLAADLKEPLNNEPVFAAPPSAGYRLQKFVRRHQIVTTAIALVVLALLLGVTMATWGLIREHAALKREESARGQADERLRAALAFVDE